MFLAHCQNVTPLRINENLGVLGKFPLLIQQAILEKVIEVLKDPDQLPVLCFSEVAIKWILEITGQSFTLPIENHSTIQAYVQLYSGLLNSNNLPKVFDAKKDEYFCILFSHFSQIFEPRKGLNTNFEKIHISLCLKVINSLNQLLNHPQNILEKESWEFLLNLLIGICDHLLINQKTLQIEPILSTELAPHILRLLFNILIQSRIQNVDIWNRLKTLFKIWRKNPQAIIQWSATIYGLMNCLIHHLYGAKEGTSDVIILIPPTEKIQFEPTRLKLDDEIVFFFQNTLNLIGNPNEIEDPKIFSLAINGIRSCVTLLLQIGNFRKRKKKKGKGFLPDYPSGNTILNLFGDYLFECVDSNRKGFEDGFEMSISILSDIFMSPQKTPFLKKYLTLFYELIMNIFENSKDGGKDIGILLLNTSQIFTTELEGVYILIPYYLFMVSEILMKKSFTLEIISKEIPIRKSCILILNSILCFPNYFSTMKFIKPISNSTIFENFRYKTFKEIKDSVSNMLTKGFQNEDDPNNATLLICSLITYLHENLDTVIPIPIIQTLCDFVCEPNSIQRKWDIFVPMCALSALSLLGSVFDKIHSKNEKIFSDLVLKLSYRTRTLLEYSNPNKKNSKFIDPLICKLFDTIEYLTHQGQYLSNEQRHFIELSQTIELALIKNSNANSKSKSKSKLNENPLIVKAALSLFQKLLNPSSSLFKSNFESKYSNFVTEDHLRKKFNLSWQEFDKRIKYLTIYKRNLLGFFEIPLKGDEHDIEDNDDIVSINENEGLDQKNVDEKDNLKRQKLETNENIYNERSNEPNLILRKYKKKKFIILVRNPNGKYCWGLHFLNMPKKTVQFNKINRQNQSSNVLDELLSTKHSSKDNTRKNLTEKNINFDCFININNIFTSEQELKKGYFQKLVKSQYDIEMQNNEFRKILKQMNLMDQSNDEKKKETEREIEMEIEREKEIEKETETEQDNETEREKEIEMEKETEKETEKERETETEMEIEKGKEMEMEKETEKEKVKKRENENSNPKENEQINLFNSSRLFLTNVGLIKPLGSFCLDFIQERKALMRHLLSLDKITNTPTHIIGVIYLSAGQNRYSDPRRIFNNTKGSEHFMKFIKKLGKIVDLKKHQAFKGNLDWKKTGRIAPYYLDPFDEIIFHVSTMLRFQSHNIDEKMDLFSRDRVIIVWLEDSRNWNPRIIKAKKNLVFIIIRPHYTGLYKIGIVNFAKSRTFNGPLTDNSFVSWEILAQLVRKTALNYSNEFESMKKSTMDSLRTRKKKLEEIQNKYIMPMDVNNFYSYLISNKKN
ncbi:hypothetical protein M0813_00168 [Anaeramoeba flamelloides]|uniref:Rap-GAP domain-containing protein n=1 Tax=Anaeramoeba flamelloides TaxID=1746091 RepID=A0ABQ8YWR1_9EUKA|nr:hypothetical protein M0813_00168 [Anaeramoeba flamelloides]